MVFEHPIPVGQFTGCSFAKDTYSAARVEYSLTARRQSLVPILYRIHDWGQRVTEDEAAPALDFT